MKKIKPVTNIKLSDIEFFELFDEEGNSLKTMKPRNIVHKEGYLHGASHVWIVDKYVKNDGMCGLKVLVQKRSANKDSFPGCYDCSAAGHVSGGEDFITAAVRELKEELGISADPNELSFLFMQRVHGDYFFHEKRFINNEINYVYLLNKKVNIEDIVCQADEIDSVMWQDLDEVIDILRRFGDDPASGYCMWLDEVEKVRNML